MDAQSKLWLFLVVLAMGSVVPWLLFGGVFRLIGVFFGSYAAMVGLLEFGIVLSNTDPTFT